MGYDKDPKCNYFEHTDVNGVVYKTTANCHPPKKGEHYLAPTGIKGKWEVKLAQDDFKKHCFIIVDVIS